VKVHDALLGPRGATLIVAFAWLLVGGTLALAFTLQAATVNHPATIATTVCGGALVIGGPALTRRLRRLMLGHRAGVG
jgi:hypothetical protein